jgi:hypothetical protein
LPCNDRWKDPRGARCEASSRSTPASCRIMPWLLALYAGASLLHFGHNAEYLAQYPNLPASWTRADVYLAWCLITGIGLAGYVFYRGGVRRVGLTLLAIYGGLGLGGLLHYTRAPIAHHSAAMNFTIWAEAAAAAGLLINVASVVARHIRSNVKTAH